MVLLDEVCIKTKGIGPVVDVPEKKHLFDALSKSGNSHQMAVVSWFLNLFGSFKDVDIASKGQGIHWCIYGQNPSRIECLQKNHINCSFLGHFLSFKMVDTCFQGCMNQIVLLIE